LAEMRLSHKVFSSIFVIAAVLQVQAAPATTPQYSLGYSQAEIEQ